MTKHTMMNMDLFGSNIAQIYATSKDINTFLNSQVTWLPDLCGGLKQVFR